MTDIGTPATDPRGIATAEETTIIHPRGFGEPGPAGEPTSGGRVYSTGVERPEAAEDAVPEAAEDAAPEAAEDAVPEAAEDAARPDTGDDARGRTTIADEVVEQVIGRIVDLAVEETRGLHGLHTAPATDSGPAGPVSVRLDGDGAEIDVAVDVEFGHRVHEVVEGLRAGLIGSAERLLGLTVAQVNINVAGVAFDRPSGEEPDQPPE